MRELLRLCRKRELGPEQRADARKQQHVVDRLGNEIVGAGLYTPDPVAHRVERRDHDDGNVHQRRIGLESPAHLEAVHARHHSDILGRAGKV